MTRIAAALVAVAAVGAFTGAVVAATSHGDPKKRPPPYRYLFHTGTNQPAAAALGFNLLDVDAKEEADALPRGARGLYWLGDYLNAPTCDWEKSDAKIEEKVRAARGDPKVWGYYFSNEPDPYGCPSAVEQHRARAQLIKSIDPTKATYISLDMNWRAQALKQIPLWRGVTDYVGLNPYICFVGHATCDFAWLRQVIAAADKARLAYFGHVQAFQAEEWRWPTPAELRRMLAQWSASKQKGYAVFTWSWGGSRLASRPQLERVLRRYNSGGTPIRRLAAANAAHEVHYAYTTASSVTFDWVGGPTVLRYGRTRKYAKKATAHAATPTPPSSSGPFREVTLRGLKRGVKYHYNIGRGADRTFAVPPDGPFRFDVEGDVGDSADMRNVAPTQQEIADDRPAFVIVAGDLTYSDENGSAAVDRHFDDVMAWSRTAAYMPAWGNHDWDSSSPDLLNYKGRFALPHPQTSPGAPTSGCCGEDWGWFDAGGVRFISYPEPYSRATWGDWRTKADQVMAAAQRDPSIRFIVTFGHRPAYSSGLHSGDATLASILDGFGDKYSKYVLNLNAHSHDYERFRPIHGVVHITAAGGGAPLEAPWRRTDPRTAYRAMHLEHLRVDVTPATITIEAICGPPTSADDMSCRPGQVIDSFTIARRR